MPFKPAQVPHQALFASPLRYSVTADPTGLHAQSHRQPFSPSLGSQTTHPRITYLQEAAIEALGNESLAGAVRTGSSSTLEVRSSFPLPCTLAMHHGHPRLHLQPFLARLARLYFPIDGCHRDNLRPKYKYETEHYPYSRSRITMYMESRHAVGTTFPMHAEALSENPAAEHTPRCWPGRDT